MALITAANFKSFAGIGDTDKDTLIGTLLTQVEARIAKFCNREFEDGSSERTEYFDGDGEGSIIWPTYLPLVSVTSLHDDTDRSYGSGTLIDSDDYVVYDNRVQLDGSVFSKGLKNIRLVYVGGYVTAEEGNNVPEDLKLYVYQALSWNLQRAGKEGLLSLSNANQNISTQFVVELPKEVRNGLMPYRRLPIV